jgi:Flp pilus assembly protein TadB
VTTPLLAYIAAINTLIAAAFMYELGAAGRRYRETVSSLLSARASAELERTLRERVNGRRNHVGTRERSADEREREQDGDKPDLLHALDPASRVGQHS